MLKNRPRTRLAVFLSVAVALGFAAGALAADADLQQYNRSAVNAENANGADALTGALLLVRDGKRITADSNGVGSAPINRSVKQLADYAAGTRCAVFGNCTGVNLRTFRALDVDSTGGVSSGIANGNIRTAAAGSSAILSPALLTIAKSAAGTTDYKDNSIVWSGTAAGGGNPTTATALKNQIRPLNTPKAWFIAQSDGAGGVSVLEGAGVTGAVVTGGDLDVTMATAMDSGNYAVTVSGLRDSLPTAIAAIPQSATVFRLDFLSGSCASVVCTVHGVVFGRQTTP